MRICHAERAELSPFAAISECSQVCCLTVGKPREIAFYYGAMRLNLGEMMQCVASVERAIISLRRLVLAALTTYSEILIPTNAVNGGARRGSEALLSEPQS